MSTRFAAGALIIGLTALSTSALAEDKISIIGDAAPEMLGSESKDAFGSRLAAVVLKTDYEIIAPCAEARSLKFRTLGSSKPNDETSAKLSENGKPFWLMEVMAVGCSIPRLHNVYVFPRAAGPGLMVAGFPGQTQASLQLQVNAQAAIDGMASSLVAGCQKPPTVIDTRIVEDSPSNKPWTEEWSLRVCNTPQRVRAKFTPGPKGVDLNIETSF